MRIGDREDKVTTLHGPHCAAQGWGRPPTVICFRDFPPQGVAAARRVHFAPLQPREPRPELFSPGQPPGVFARPATISDHAAAQPACNR
jgi:hypothetical protein